MLTRLNGPEFALNPDLIERAESTPDTVISLVDGKKYVVTESVAELVRRVRLHRASVLALAHELELTGGSEALPAPSTPSAPSASPPSPASGQEGLVGPVADLAAVVSLPRRDR